MLTLNYAGDTAAEAPSQHLGLEDFERAGVRVAERRFGEKDTIFAPGDPDNLLYILLEGTVRLYKIYGDYKEATIALLKDGGVFGELSLDEVPCENAFAEAVTDIRVAKVGKSALNEVIKRRPSFAMKLFFAFSERLRHQDLANMIVSTREAVSKVMSEFQRAGLIEVRKRRISVSPQLAKSRVSNPSWSPGAGA